MKTQFTVLIVVIILALALTSAIVVSLKLDSNGNMATTYHESSSSESSTVSSTSSSSAIRRTSTTSQTGSQSQTNYSISVTKVIQDPYLGNVFTDDGYYILDVNMSVQNGIWYVNPDFFHLTIYNVGLAGYNSGEILSVSHYADMAHPLNATFLCSSNYYCDVGQGNPEYEFGQIAFAAIYYSSSYSSFVLNYNGSNLTLNQIQLQPPQYATEASFYKPSLANVNLSRIQIPAPTSSLSKITRVTSIVDFETPYKANFEPQTNGFQVGFSFSTNSSVSPRISGSEAEFSSTPVMNLSATSSGSFGIYYTGNLVYFYFYLPGNITIKSITTTGFVVESDPQLPFGCTNCNTISLRVGIIFPQTSQSNITLTIDAT